MSGFALVLGLPHEPPVAAVSHELQRIGARHAIVNQRQLLGGEVQTWWLNGAAGGIIRMSGQDILLDEVTGAYSRLTTWASLPEIAADPPLLQRAQLIHHALEAWLETSAARVINRTSANDTNNSKPYQAMIIRDYFDVPAALVTNDPAAALAFRDELGQVIYKSVSGERSIVTMLADEDIARLPLLTSGPVQFQEYVAGIDVRVHVVGQRVFASQVDSDAVDYRYSSFPGDQIRPVAIADDVAARCVALTARLGLELSGIDLRYAEDGRIVCFEVNPSPAYTVFEPENGQQIAAAIAQHMVGASHPTKVWG